MAIYTREPESKYTTAPEGLHGAVGCDVVDLGLVTDQFGTRPMVELRWMLERLDTQDADERRIIVRKRYRNSLHEKAGLRRDLEMWRGKKFSADELRGFDLERLIGVSCPLGAVVLAGGLGAMRRAMNKDRSEFDPRKALIEARKAARQICQLRFEAFGCAGQASRITVVPLEKMARKYAA